MYNEGTPLPIKILSVEAAIKNSDVNISWQSANELNTTDIIVQRSTDGTDFIEIGKLKAIGSGSNGYQFTDKNPNKGLNYYRLQSFDKDGTFTFSKVVSAYFGKKPLFSIAPNPARDITTINFNKTNDKANVTVYDLKGKVVISKSIIDANSNVYKLNTQPLTNGIYIIKVNTSTDSYNEKLLINK